MRTRHLCVGLASAFVLTALIFGMVLPAQAAAGSGGVGAGPAPGAPGVLAGGGYFAPTLSPGTTWTSELVVANDSARTAPIVVYGTDGLTAKVSGAVYSNIGQPLRATGIWVTPASQTVTLPPYGNATVRFSIKVPLSATSGDHLAGIAAQNGSLSTSSSGDLRVAVVARAVVGVLVRVPGPASFSAALGAPTVTNGPDGVGEVVTPLTDTGELIGKPTINVTLSGAGGYKNSVTKQVDTLLPGGTADFPVYWPDPLHGTYRITSCLTWSGRSVPTCRSATVMVSGPTKTVKDLYAKTAGSTGSHIPDWAVILFSACAGAALMGLVLRLRRPRPRTEPPSHPDPGSPPDAGIGLDSTTKTRKVESLANPGSR